MADRAERGSAERLPSLPRHPSPEPAGGPIATRRAGHGGRGKRRWDTGGMTADADEVDRIVDDWERERPDLDFAPLQVFSRVGRLSKLLDRAQASVRAVRTGVVGVRRAPALRRAGTPFRLPPKVSSRRRSCRERHHDNRIDRVGRARARHPDDRRDWPRILVEMRPRRPGAAWTPRSRGSSTPRPSCSPAAARERQTGHAAPGSLARVRLRPKASSGD